MSAEPEVIAEVYDARAADPVGYHLGCASDALARAADYGRFDCARQQVLYGVVDHLDHAGTAALDVGHKEIADAIALIEPLARRIADNFQAPDAIVLELAGMVDRLRGELPWAPKPDDPVIILVESERDLGAILDDIDEVEDDFVDVRNALAAAAEDFLTPPADEVAQLKSIGNRILALAGEMEGLGT